jgi:hydrogenase maturation protein HypF
MCWEAGIEWSANPAPVLAHQAWQRNVNTPVTSAVGRLFDAAAAIVLGIHATTFEGQGPMMLEACAAAGEPVQAGLPLDTDSAGLLRIDWAPLVSALSGLRGTREDLAWLVHAVLARTIVEVALKLHETHQFDVVGLTGGVFQNRKLTEHAADQLEGAGFRIWLNEHIPCNDGGLALGQIVEASARAVAEASHA